MKAIARQHMPGARRSARRGVTKAHPPHAGPLLGRPTSQAENAAGIALGILLTGPGEVWVNGARFDVVGPEVAVTGSNDEKTPDKAVNLDFAE